MVGVDFGKHRLGGDEHHRAIRGFSGHDVFLGDGFDVAPHIGTEQCPRRAPVAVGQAFIVHAVVVFQRKLGIHAHSPARGRQFQHAVGPRAVAQHMLKGKRRGRQHVAHQPFELDFAKRPPRALVAEQLLQAHDVAGQAVYFLLRLVYGCQARHHAGEGLVGFAETFIKALVHMSGYRFEPFVEHARKAIGCLRELARGGLQAVLQQFPIRARMAR